MVATSSNSLGEKQMKKAMILLTAILIAGCDVQAQSERLATHDRNRIREVCIDGVIYLIYSGFKEGGITPKVNKDFYPYTCNNKPKEEKHNGKTTQ